VLRYLLYILRTRQQCANYCVEINLDVTATCWLTSKYVIKVNNMADDEVTLISSDHKSFKVKREVAEESEAIRSILADTSDDSAVPLMNVRSHILERVIQFCKFSVDMKAKDGEKSLKSSDEVCRLHAFMRRRVN
jgi:5'(3')-deoxyribonucleotidase